MDKIIKILSIIFIIIIYTKADTAFAQSTPPPAFVKPPELIEDPGSSGGHSSESRKFTGISSMAVSENGRMWAVWYAGPTPGEDKNNYVVVATSADNGDTWKEVLAIDPDGSGPVRAFDPQIWVDPNGKLWVFWAQGIFGLSGKIPFKQDDYIAGVWVMTNDNPSDSKANWTAPKRLTNGIMMGKPTVLSDGDWALPVATWQTRNSARMVVSSDEGKTFHLRGACKIPEELRNADEHMIVEKEDHSLWMLVRVKAKNNPTGIMECRSTDGGQTWSRSELSDIRHPMSRFFIRRLQSGNLLLVKHGPISEKIGRSHLMAFISKDDGNSWSKGLLLDERPGISYPDGQQTKDGTIYITYDFQRYQGKNQKGPAAQHILMTSFTEKDILSEKYDENIIKVFDNRKLISDGGRQ